ncbi:fucolectin-related molecule, partial [Plakobranchus ocellatus]
MLKFITLFSTVLATLASPTTAKCRERGWFGSKCQYMCHCENGLQCDRTTGACPGKCERGWFGPACQYERIRFSDFDETKPPSPTFSVLSDDQQTTCIGSPERAFIDLWSYNYALTWLRIQGSSAEDLSELQFSPLKGPAFSCRSAIVDSTTVDFFCHNAESSILLAIWNPKKAVLCSVYISRDSYDRLLNGFTLVAYDEDGKPVYHQTDTEPEYIYTLEVPFERFIAKPVKSVEIVKYKHAKVLSLCEVMLFGDSACPAGKFGRECERDCNCADRQDACFVSTGSCPSGCAPGYTGEGCWTTQSYM